MYLAFGLYVFMSISTGNSENTIIINKNVIALDDYLVKIHDENLRNMTELLLRECPDTDVCGSLVEGFQDSPYGCCISCSCDVSCQETQTCCPHVQFELKNSNLSLEMTNYSCKFATILNRGSDVFGDEYYFYSSCPRGTDQETKKMCETTDYGADLSFEDTTPVTDRRSNLNYFNRHCADCHNVPTESQEFWLPWILCRFPLDVSEWSNIAAAIVQQDDCVVQFKTPKGLDTNLTLCSSDIISECNVTGGWTTYDGELEAACQQFPLRYIDDVVNKGRTTYHNIFCAICNGVDVKTSRAACSRGSVTSLFNLLVFVNRPAKAAEKHAACENRGLYDPIRDECQSLHCTLPLTLVPHEHTCSSFMQYISRAGYIVPFKVSLTGPQLTLVSAYVIGEALFNHIYELRTEVLDVHYVHFYYKLEKTFKQLSSLDVSLPIKDVFILVYVGIDFVSHPDSQLQMIVMSIKNKTLTVNETVLKISYGDVDGNIQTPLGTYHQDVLNLKTTTKLPGLFNTTVFNITVIEDPYDHMSIVGGLKYPFDMHQSIIALLYDQGHMRCSAFLYDLDNINLKRVPGGFGFKGKTIGFGHFQSVNESHVLICAGTVKELFEVSRGNRLRVHGVLLLTTVTILGKHFCLTKYPLCYI